MVDVRGDVLRPPHGTTPAAVKSNKNQKWDHLRAMETFIRERWEGGSYYVVSANKSSSVTLQSPGNESQRKHAAILRISNRQSIQRLNSRQLFFKPSLMLIKTSATCYSKKCLNICVFENKTLTNVSECINSWNLLMILSLKYTLKLN